MKKTDIALSQIDERKLIVLEEITTLINTEKTNLQTIGEGYKANFEQVDVELNQKIEDIKQEINPETYVTQIQSDNWQKYSFTEDDGAVKELPTDTDISTLTAGLYEGSSLIKTPYGDNGFYEIYVTQSYNGRKVIIAISSYSGRTSIKTFHSGGAERNWRELTNATEDTGWLEVMLKNNVTSINPVNYKIVTMNNTEQLSIKGSISNIAADSEVNFGKIPSIETIGVPYIINTFPSNIKMWIENDGEAKSTNSSRLGFNKRKH